MFKEARRASIKNKKSPYGPQFDYLREIEVLLKLKCKATSSKDFMNLDQIEEALKVNLAEKVKFVMGQARETRDTISKKNFTNFHYALDIVKLSQAHIRYVTFWYFKEKLKTVKCPNNVRNLTNLCMLYGLVDLSKDSTSCFECGYFTAGASRMILEAIKEINRLLRP